MYLCRGADALQMGVLYLNGLLIRTQHQFQPQQINSVAGFNQLNLGMYLGLSGVPRS